MDDAPLSNAPENQLARVAQAASDAMTDTMVERLTITGTNALEIVDRLNDETTRDAIHNALDRLTELHRVGALDTLFDAVTVMHAARSAATDGMLERLFIFLEHMVNTVGTEDLAILADETKSAIDEAAAETSGPPPKGGLMATLALLGQPETQQSLRFLLAVAAKLRERSGT
jgi:uncharacterized protein YjgD (DUF1641 family)